MGLKKKLNQTRVDTEDLHLKEMKNLQKVSFPIKMILTLVLAMVMACQIICCRLPFHNKDRRKIKI